MKKTRRARVLVVALTVCAAAACSVTPERLLLEDFFAASRLRDRTALQAFSTVVFEPATQGMVTDFTIAGVETMAREGRPSKEVTVEALVRRPGEPAKATVLIVTLSRREGDGQSAPGRWMVVGVQERAPRSVLPTS